jgi:CubicO group peptidase (beta-lactamase class C family)
MIVEKVAGVPLVDFLQTRIFGPLQMKSVANIDAAGLGTGDASGYMRIALAPVRPAPKEAKGWLFAAGELAMNARDLALWDISVINRTVLKPASYQIQQTDMLLKNGVATQYGLGVQVNVSGGRRRIAHGGEVSGYTTRNEIYPDDKAAIVVFTNLDATGASSQIATRIANTIFGSVDLDSKNALVQAKAIFAGLQKGSIKASLFSDNEKAYFSKDALADFQSSLGTLGAPTEFVQTGSALRGGMTLRTFRIRAGGRIMNLTAFWLPSGLLEQYQIARAE